MILQKRVQLHLIGHEHFAGFRADEGADDAHVFELIDDARGAGVAHRELARIVDHPNVAIRLNNLGSVLKALGELAQARSYYEGALEVFRERLGDDHPNTQTVRGNLDVLLGEMK